MKRFNHKARSSAKPAKELLLVEEILSKIEQDLEGLVVAFERP